MKEPIIVHSMAELVELLNSMPDAGNIDIRVEYETDGDADAKKQTANKRTAVNR